VEQREVTPFRITLTLATRAMLRADMTLDSVLAAAVFRLTGSFEAAHEQLPLKRTDHVWHASTITFLEGDFDTSRYVCRMSSNDWIGRRFTGAENRKGRISVRVSGGTYAPQVRAIRNFIGRVAFDACGDASAVETLVLSLPGIGKNANQGGGRIADVEIEPLAADRSIQAEGCIRRPVPEHTWVAWGRSLDGQVRDVCGWRPPYWRVDQHERCGVPER
jgi:CRISPR type IV-associated protein Csf3